MNEPPLPDGRGYFDNLAEAVTPPYPKTRTAIAPATDRLRVPVAMPEQEELPLPYGFTRRSLLAVGAAFLISLCLFGYGAGIIIAIAMPKLGSELIVDGCSQFLAVLAGGSFLGGALGAAIGKASLDDKGVAHIMGAFVGALAGPLVVLILLLEFAVLCAGMSV
jgi:hypothetical protein